MIIGLASIMHTGTHLVREMLMEHLKAISPDALDRDGFYGYHLVNSCKKYTQLNYPTISPMRHPVRILESFRRRDKTIDMMEEQFHNFSLLRDPIIIHVDRADRDDYVNRAAKRTGLPLSTDWPLLSPKNTLGFKVTPERLKEIPEWIMDLYSKTL